MVAHTGYLIFTRKLCEENQTDAEEISLESQDSIEEPQGSDQE